MRRSSLLACAALLACLAPAQRDAAIALDRDATLTADGLTLPSRGESRVSIGLAAIGRATLTDVRGVGHPVMTDGEARITRAPGVVEWWRALAIGLEQGVTIDRRPAGDGELVLEMTAGENVSTERASDDRIVLRDPRGAELARYEHLVVTDASGAVIPARLAAAGDRIQVHIHDARARYPLVVDPIVPLAEAGTSSWVQLTADGTRAFGWGGATHDRAQIGRRAGTTWVAETSFMPLRPADLSADLDISGDGLHAVVTFPFQPAGTCGGSGNNSCAYVFARTGTTWAPEPVFRISDQVGQRVAMDGAGDRFVAGAVAAGISPHVYAYNGTSWYDDGTLTTSGSVSAVAISADGTRVAVLANQFVSVFTGPGAWARETMLGPLAAGAISLDATGTRLSFGARVYVRSGTTWTLETTLTGPGGHLSSDGVRLAMGTSLYLRSGTTWTAMGTLPATAQSISGDGLRAYLGLPGSGSIYSLFGADGTPCGVGGECTSTFCADGVCCNTACGGGALDDCQACSAARSGAADGTCSAAIASTVCRASAGPCDVADTCTGASTTCPADVFATSATTCRAPAMPCDAAEVCTGTGAACPTDLVSPMGTICRAEAGPCDTREVCSGSTMVCPPDLLAPIGMACRAAVSVCDVPEACDGSSALCPADLFAPSTTACGAVPMGPCDLTDHCAGTSAICVALFQVAGTPCGPAVSGDCDAPDMCTGASGECLPAFRSAVVCRASAGACDPAELCLGDTPDCPPDQVSPASMVCRASTGACDPAESCDGVEGTCTADVTTCPDTGVLPDAGTDASRPDAAQPDGAVRDAASATDAATPGVDAGAPAPVGGCGCHASTRPTPLALLALLLLSFVRRTTKALAPRSGERVG